MTKKEVIKFLESYQALKNIEKIRIATIEEMEQNIKKIKKLSYDHTSNDTKNISQNEAICSKIIDMKNSLAREIYSNTIRLKYIEEYINAIAFEDIRLGTCLCFRYITGLTNVQIAKEFRYSESSVKIFIRDGINKLYELLKDIDIKTINDRISNDSNISIKKINKSQH